MDATLKGILKILDSADPETRCAALVVLTNLEADDQAVATRVGQLLAATNAVIRDFALGYFEAVQTPAGLPALLGLLDHEDPTVRRRAVDILVRHGASAVSAARKLLKDAPRRRVHAIVDLCARVRSAAALDVVFSELESDDADASRHACDALLNEITALDARGRSELFSRSERLAAVRGAARWSLIAAAKLLGALGQASARKSLFGLLKQADPEVRTHTLSALVSCLRGQTLTTAEIATLFAELSGDDETGVLRPVVRILEEQSLDRAYVAKLEKLAASGAPLVKRFAVQKLGGFDGGSVVKTLIGYLDDESYARRDQAATSLKQLPAARAALMKEFLQCDDERRAWRLSEILLAHDRSWKSDARSALEKRLEYAVEKRDDRLHTAYFHFLSALDADATAELVRQRAEQRRKSSKLALSLRWLQLLRDTPALDAAARYTLAIAELKSRPHASTPALRRKDSALEGLRALGASTFPLVERLRKEKSLDAGDLLYVAFDFAEGDDDERDTAVELLQHLVTTAGRTKVGKAAKNKLALLQSAR